ncbi:Hypothetical protein TRIATDRAFT_300716 [Trichoderma atroviride IMI 206040]|uniref:Circumsporozoite protein n=1 Tax=Hypocrea atroviridis (strain ATCC 20476 / IMI 206040) TaxID=452589 RepID=G9P168_HYPAI|nr:Hypothetical protein TRIATDRAFT_300716 [Trichoderma atroviride IMI 206040]EHK42476.1 Hypothetical protein TRIATDRAFT_300716 [Trichoderma atroviride IMI 206040]
MKSSLAASVLLAVVAEARFGQEQGNGAITAIGALTNLGQPGQAATLAGGSIQFLLAAANPCGKLTQADLILSELGTSDAAVAAARGLVAAEQNFNPFVVSVPSICGDATLPKSAQLRGVVPLIDPAVTGSDLENKNANASKTTPFAADGLSVAQVMINQGFSNFTIVNSDGSKQQASGDSAAAAPSSSQAANVAAAKTTALAVTAVQSEGCGIPTTMVTITRTAIISQTAAASNVAAATSAAAASGSAASSGASSDTNNASAGTCTGGGSTLACSSPSNGAGAVKNAVTGNFDGFVKSTIAGLDFGLCVPTMKFEAGLDGRKDTEFTFQAIDPLVNKGQEEALNPNIITNRIHDQLTNVCGANAAAKAAAADAQTKISALGTKNADTANTWNSLLGFANTNINPDNAPVAGLVGHT